MKNSLPKLKVSFLLAILAWQSSQAAQPTATLSGNGTTTTLEVNPGDSITYTWTSANARSASSTYYADSANDCGHPTTAAPWIINTLQGSTQATISDCAAGHTYTLTYIVADAAGQSAQSVIKLVVESAKTLPPPPDPITLISPCERAYSLSKPFSLQVATIAGAAGLALTPGETDAIVQEDEALVLLVEAQEIECGASESAYHASARNNLGTAGAAETTRYAKAYNQLAQTVSLLPTSSPGQNAFDQSINAELARFYSDQVATFEKYENLESVKELQARFRQAFAALVQTSIDCRRANRQQGAQDCPTLASQLALYDYQLGGLVDETLPTVNSLTLEIADLVSTGNGLSSQMQQGVSTTQSDQQLLQQLIDTAQADQQQIMAIGGALQGLNGAAQYYWSMYAYYLNWAYYCAAYGYWGYYGAFLQAAGSYGAAWQTTVYVYIPYYQSAAAQLQQQLLTLQSEIPGLQQQLVQLQSSLSALQSQQLSNMTSIEMKKALLVAIPVVSFKN